MGRWQCGNWHHYYHHKRLKGSRQTNEKIKKKQRRKRRRKKKEEEEKFNSLLTVSSLVHAVFIDDKENGAIVLFTILIAIRSVRACLLQWQTKKW
jgi:hypothetical protein